MVATEDKAYASFVRELRRALRHLYDPDELRKSSLLRLLPANGQEEPSSLQRILLSAIEALKPTSTVAPQSNAWRTYRTLSAHYVQQFRQSEVARSFGLSLRQMRRQESLALRVLAQHLWAHHDLEGKAHLLYATSSPPGPDPSAGQTALSRERELEWLERSLPSEPIAIGEMIQALAETVSPLTQALGVCLHCTLPADLPRPVAQAAALRQALLNVLTMAIRAAPAGEVGISAGAHADELQICLSPAARGTAARIPATDQAESIEMARQLLAPSGGSVELVPPAAEASFAVRLLLPLAEQAPVLVVDDNADALELYQRYLAGSRYAFVGARDPEQGLDLAARLAPRVIVLDVMLPLVDGWELLGRLRAHPSIRDVPVIVCTILPQEQLALALGAAAFLRKPVSRAALLAALDKTASLPGRQE